MDINWKLISEKRFKAGFRNMIERLYELPDGTEHSYTIMEAGPAVCVLPITKENKVILVEIFRPGPNKILMELPGGYKEAELSPEEAIEKELLEETGYTGNFKLVGSSYEDAYTTMYRYHFIATDCEKVQEPEREFDEFMNTVELPMDEFINHLRSGELTDPETGYIGLSELGLV